MLLSSARVGPRAVALGMLAASAVAALSIAAPVAGAVPDNDVPASVTGSLGSLAVASGSASSDAHSPAPYIADASWAAGRTDRALRVTPTDAGRTSWGPADEANAWAELVALAPDVDTPGMRQQFTCHWIFARVVAPERRAWQFEPGRPSVPDVAMVATGCNPDSGSSTGS